MRYRSLVTYPITKDTKKATTPVPDLATDTGQSSNGGKVWKFTLKDGVKWQDGKPITCADLKYGVSRSFATDVITGGPNYILGFLDVPKSKDGLPLYNGPYKNAHKADFDKAVTCSSDNKTITYQFNKPFPDFPLAVGLAARRSTPTARTRTRATSPTTRSSPAARTSSRASGTPARAARSSATPDWSTKTDDVRKALPDKIVFTQGLTPEVVNDRLISDTGQDQMAVTDQRHPAGRLLADHRPGQGPLDADATPRSSTTCCRTSTGSRTSRSGRHCSRR